MLNEIANITLHYTETAHTWNWNATQFGLYLNVEFVKTHNNTKWQLLKCAPHFNKHSVSFSPASFIVTLNRSSSAFSLSIFFLYSFLAIVSYVHVERLSAFFLHLIKVFLSFFLLFHPIFFFTLLLPLPMHWFFVVFFQNWSNFTIIDNKGKVLEYF